MNTQNPQPNPTSPTTSGNFDARQEETRRSEERQNSWSKNAKTSIDRPLTDQEREEYRQQQEREELERKARTNPSLRAALANPSAPPEKIDVQDSSQRPETASPAAPSREKPLIDPGPQIRNLKDLGPHIPTCEKHHVHMRQDENKAWFCSVCWAERSQKLINHGDTVFEGCASLPGDPAVADDSPQKNAAPFSGEKLAAQIVAAQVIADRQAIYGDPRVNMAALGKHWTALLEYHYHTKLPHDIPAHVAAIMMVAMKLGRAVAPTQGTVDNYVDGHGYLRIAEELDPRLEEK